MTNELYKSWLNGARATDGGPELTEETLEAALIKIEQHRVGYGFACFRRAYIDNVLPPRPPRMRKEFAQLYDGDTFIGQLMIERLFEARDNLPFVERVHPDDMVHMGLIPGGPPHPKRGARIQRFYLHNGRYRLEGSY